MTRIMHTVLLVIRDDDRDFFLYRSKAHSIWVERWGFPAARLGLSLPLRLKASARLTEAYWKGCLSYPVFEFSSMEFQGLRCFFVGKLYYFWDPCPHLQESSSDEAPSIAISLVQTSPVPRWGQSAARSRSGILPAAPAE